MSIEENFDAPGSSSDVVFDDIVVNDVPSILPTTFSQLFARSCRNKGEKCVVCKAEFEMSDLQIGCKDVVVFHYFCLIFDHTFQGKVDQIQGFATLSREHRDLLRSNANVAGGESESESDVSEDFYNSDLGDEDFDDSPPAKRPTSNPTPREPNTPKSKEKEEYENTIKAMCGEECKMNPERSWKYRADDPAKNKQHVKRGVLIDKEFKEAATSYVVTTEKDDLYAVTLVLCDIVQNRNTYFKMQLLRLDEFEEYHVFRSWGRIGTKRGACFDEAFTHLDDAVLEFEKDFEALTANRWRERHFYHAKSGYMHLIEMDYSEFETMIYDENGSLIPAGSCSNLPHEIKRILLEIFNSKNIKKALDEYNLDLERMPLGKLSARQLSRASVQLKIIEDAVKKEGVASADFDTDAYTKRMNELSDLFYSTLPQSFGHVTPSYLSKQRDLEKMRGMLDALFDIHFVCNIMAETRKESLENGLDPLDLQYKKLMTNMDVVPENADEFKRIQAYIDNGLAATHGYSKIKLLDLIKMERYGEAVKFKHNLSNRKLLWHGSPVQNFPGILTQGLKIAPADSIQSGKAFGMGVYFADMISKSANYCRAEKGIGYLLLCDVALGNQKTQTYGSFSGIGPNEKYNSMWGVGSTKPDPSGDLLMPEGYSIPMGKAITDQGRSERSGGFLYYNEFIVYDTDQIQVRYLVRVDLGTAR